MEERGDDQLLASAYETKAVPAVGQRCSVAPIHTFLLPISMNQDEDPVGGREKHLRLTRRTPRVASLTSAH